MAFVKVKINDGNKNAKLYVEDADNAEKIAVISGLFGVFGVNVVKQETAIVTPEVISPPRLFNEPAFFFGLMH